MNSPEIPAPRPESLADGLALESKIHAMQELKCELATLHARLEYVRILLKLGVGLG